MTDIKFAKDYGYPPAAPFWLVWNENGKVPMHKHTLRDEAETEAARLAILDPGASFHVLAVMARVATSPEVVGKRFDPNRKPLPDPIAPEFIEEAPVVCADVEPI